MYKNFVIIFSACLLFGCQPAPTEKSADFSAKKTETKSEQITLTEFFDFQCGYCRNSHSTMKNLKSIYGEKLKIEYKHYPSFPGSMFVAQAAECARDQNKFADFQDTYFAAFFQKTDNDSMKALATNIGIDTNVFMTCLSSDIKRSDVELDIQAGRKIGVSAVPFFRVGDADLLGAYPQSVFEKLIDSQLKTRE